MASFDAALSSPLFLPTVIFCVGAIFSLIGILCGVLTSSHFSLATLPGREKIAIIILGIIFMIIGATLYFRERQSLVRENNPPTSPVITEKPIVESLPNLIILSGQPNSAFNLIGEKLRENLQNSSIKNQYNITTEPTSGGVMNCQRLEEKNVSTRDIKIGFVQLAAHDEKQKCNRGGLRYIAPLYDEVVHFAVRKKIFDTLSKWHTKIDPCLINEIGLPISIGQDGSATQMTARGILNACDQKKHNSPLNKTLTFIETKNELHLSDGLVKAGFFNQAEQSGLLEQLVEGGAVCFIPLSEDFDTARDDLFLKKYEPQPQNDSVQSFYNKNTCHIDSSNKENKFRSWYSISVIAVKNSDVPPDVVQEILTSIYSKLSIFKDIAPRFLSCEKVQAMISGDPKLSDHGGIINADPTTKKYYGSCP